MISVDFPEISTMNFHKPQSPENFQFQIAPFRKQTRFFPSKKQVQPSCSVWDLFFLSVYHIRFRKRKPIHYLNFSSNNSQEQRGFVLQRGLLDGISYNVPKSSNPQLCVEQSFFSSNPRLIEVANWLISCISMWLGISTIVLLHYGWIEVEGGWVFENALDDQENILKV